MPAPDRIRRSVKNALVKDGWTITADPLTLEFEEAQLFVDLAAEKLLALEKDDARIAVEIKTFGGRSPMTELHSAVGQFIIYSTFLRHTDPDRKLFLAISDAVYDEFFAQKAVQTVTEENRVSLIIVDLVGDDILRWIT